MELVGGTHNLPPGYLFLCPLSQFQTEVPACFGIPDWPAYWSLDPSGRTFLTEKEARNYGFPEVRLRMEVRGRWWDDRVLTGIREFQAAKGFDPYSEEVTRELALPRYYRTSSEEDTTVAYGEHIVWVLRITSFLLLGHATDEEHSVTDTLPRSEDSNESDDRYGVWRYANDEGLHQFHDECGAYI